LVVTAPGFAGAAPGQVESVSPSPPSLNGRAPARHQAAPAPIAEPAASEPRETTSFSVKGALDKIFASSDSQIGEKLRGIVASKQLDKRVERPADRKAIEAFYASRNYAPLWVMDGALTARAKTTIARLKNAAADGLDAADYPTPDFGSASGAEQLADADVTLTNSALTFARHLDVGRIAPTRVLVEVDYGDHTPDPAEILRKLAGAGDANAVFDSYNPQEASFKALKNELAALRANASANTNAADNRIPAGAPIRPGTKDARVPNLREHLGIPGKANDLVYDRRLFDAIKRVQANADMRPTGIVDGKTIAIINGPKPGDEVDRVIANMERWRWLPRDLGKTYVMVNVPDYSLKVVHDHQVVWRTKIVAGKPQTPT